MPLFVKMPHLPKGKVGELIIGERYRPRLEAALAAFGVEALWLPPVPGVDPRLAGHADLGALHLGGNRLVLSEGFRREAVGGDVVNKLTNRGCQIIWSAGRLGPAYPTDAGLNACIFGNTLIHRLAITDQAVLDHFGGARLNVPQGYAKCAVCVVDEKSVMTSDHGIARKLADSGTEVLLISAGHVALEGFDTGFIGGASFYLSERQLAFAGTLDGHPDKKRIVGFLKNRDIEPVYLTDTPIFDIGSAIPLVEA